MHISNECGNCEISARSRRREFSDQIWSVLITWGEVGKSLVDSPICDDCYNEFRETLIDRATELELALADPAKYDKMIKEQQAKEKEENKKAAKTKAKATVKEKPKKKETTAVAKKVSKKKAAKKVAKKVAAKKTGKTAKKSRVKKAS
ncbi:hypothetical protein N9D31_01885 [Oligoflexaceae bacterium]|nr:hypothetical protein [Oligoflexaceae bacterium]